MREGFHKAPEGRQFSRACTPSVSHRLNPSRVTFVGAAETLGLHGDPRDLPPLTEGRGGQTMGPRDDAGLPRPPH